MSCVLDFLLIKKICLHVKSTLCHVSISVPRVNASITCQFMVVSSPFIQFSPICRIHAKETMKIHQT